MKRRIRIVLGLVMLMLMVGCNKVELPASPEDVVVKADVQNYVETISGKTVEISIFEILNVENVSEEELKIICNVLYEEDEEEQKGKFNLKYVLKEDLWVLSSCIMEEDPSAEEEVYYDSETMYKITLTADEEMSVKDYNEAVEILKGRLDVFTDGENYAMDVLEDTITLILPKSAFGELEVEQALQCYISRAINLYFAENSGWGFENGSIPIERDDISNVELKYGTLEGVDVTALELESDEYQYVEITFTDEFMAANGETISSWTSPIFAQDIEAGYEQTWYHYTYRSDVPETYYIINNDMGGKFAELVVYNFTHDSLANGFYYNFDIEADVEWENVEETQSVGNNQCNVNALEGHTVTLSYSNDYEELSAGEWIDLHAAIKTRLDMLEQPYAYGMITSESDDQADQIVIKTGLEHMGNSIIEMLCDSGSFRVENTWSVISSLWSSELECIEYADGTYGLKVIWDEYDVEKVNNLITEALEKGNNRISFGINYDYTEVLQAYVTEETTAENIVFTEFVYGDEKKITDENVWLINLIKAIWDDDIMPISLNLQNQQINVDENEPSEPEYGVKETRREDTKMMDLLEEIVPDAEIIINKNGIYIYCDLYVDETFPESAVELAKKIYTESGFEESIYQNINLYYIDEDDSVKERARIFFSKEKGSNGEDGTITAWGIFANGRMERYKEKVIERIESDEFLGAFDQGYMEWMTEY